MYTVCIEVDGQTNLCMTSVRRGVSSASHRTAHQSTLNSFSFHTQFLCSKFTLWQLEVASAVQ